MATQLVSNAKCQQVTGHKQEFSAAYRERERESSPSNHQNYTYHRIQNSSSEPETNLKQALLHQLGFSYLASSFRYVLMKVKAFYNRFLGDSGNESAMAREAPMVEPYFSIPVHPNTAPPAL